MIRPLFLWMGLALSSACDVSAVVESYPEGVVDAGVVPDATADANSASAYGCGVTFSQEGDWVTMTTATTGGDVIQQGGGGDIVPGMYLLTGLAGYLGAPTGNVEARETLLVLGTSSGTFVKLTEVMSTSPTFPSYAAHGESSSFTVEPVVMGLDVVNTCPSMSLDTPAYTATPTSLTIFDDATSLAWTYTAK